MSAKKQNTHNPSYETAFAELQQLLADIETETINIDELSEKVQRAAELIAYCRAKLRHTEEDIQNVLKNML